MTDALRAAAQQALEALERAALQPVGKNTQDAITALRAALAEPVATIGMFQVIDGPKPPTLEWDEGTPKERLQQRLEALQAKYPVGPDVKLNRLRRKLEQRDRRIAGLERHIEQLERTIVGLSIAHDMIDSTRLKRDITRAVQEALCNVRMIPMHIGSRIREVDVSVVAKETGAKL